ncbi:hypothetical protein K402DRAFT_419695 [Aulographum hederae CBS 113979]|uniref:Protein SDS23 n=1 Tax=Aulographum hederae CBS 113979 TaxID=1176131 RepID=A0A6G1H5M1_9PEZI|nr:hypothetical protein K402DRAFT_419695 [Aulographum hederae CBS 113979]
MASHNEQDEEVAAQTPEKRSSAIQIPGKEKENQTRSTSMASVMKDPLIRTPSSPQTQTHRHSFAENLRGIPPSPRAHRQPSLSQQALQELLNMPPIGSTDNKKDQTNRDWRTITVGEITDPALVRFVELDTSVEDATKVLTTSGSPNVVLIRESPSSRTPIGTFDYSDLNAYLLLVVGVAQPEEKQVELFNEIAKKAKAQEAVPLKLVKGVGRKEGLTTLPDTATLTKAVELFGSGIHRIVIMKEHTADAVGVLTQLRLVEYFWQNSRTFNYLDKTYMQYLKDLDVGSQHVIAINGDKPLTDALEIMYNEGITSLPIIDNQANVLGNISHVDVRLLTKTTSFPLLRSSCIHFISVILSERGVDDGKDSFPVFHVSPYSTLAHTVAKLVATRSHRMWIVDSPSPSSSGPSTPGLTPVMPHHKSPFGSSSDILLKESNLPHAYNTSSPPSHTPGSTLSAASMQTSSLSGRLWGVVSLTDILNLFARASGLSPHDPNETRRQRRRSSSVSLGSAGGFGVRRSIDSARSERSEVFQGEVVGRSGSVHGRRF